MGFTSCGHGPCEHWVATPHPMKLLLYYHFGHHNGLLAAGGAPEQTLYTTVEGAAQYWAAAGNQFILPLKTTSLLPCLLWKSSQHLTFPSPLKSILTPQIPLITLLFSPSMLHHCKIPPDTLIHSCGHLYSHPMALSISPMGLSSPCHTH